MATRSIRLDDELWKTLSQEAGRRLVSVNWLVAQLLRESLKRLADEIKVTT